VTGKHEPNVVLKDNDLKHKLRIPKDAALMLLDQLNLDAELLSSQLRVMDYSLLGSILFCLFAQYMWIRDIDAGSVGVHNTQYKVDYAATPFSEVSNQEAAIDAQKAALNRFPVRRIYIYLCMKS
jgi:hypothetical protein